LQALIFGYGGLRLHVEELSFNGMLPLPPDSTFMTLNRVKYLGSVITFNYTSDSIWIIVDSASSSQPLELVTRNNGVIDLKSEFFRFALHIQNYTFHSFSLIILAFLRLLILFIRYFSIILFIYRFYVL
jgi:hypothetical protein